MNKRYVSYMMMIRGRGGPPISMVNKTHEGSTASYSKQVTVFTRVINQLSQLIHGTQGFALRPWMDPPSQAPSVPQRFT